MIDSPSTTRLDQAVDLLVAQHPGLSGIHPLADALDAFSVRRHLALAAERTLDVQYYIWRRDLSGTLLMKALLDAADRGVRVRLLLDDHNTPGLDAPLAAINRHPRVEVRLFNPAAIRWPRPLAFVTDFRRMNRRMHNKSFTTDNRVTVIGGRNVGDEYFAATTGVVFADLDAIGIGPVVDDVSADFERYWNCPAAVPVDKIVPRSRAEETSVVRERGARAEQDGRAVGYMRAVDRSDFAQQLRDGTLAFEWAVTRMVSDPPDKVLGGARQRDLLFPSLHGIFGTPAESVDLVSPYFVPGNAGSELFSEWAGRGVRVRVLTNSLEATDVAVVHAGYAKRRRRLLRAGIMLYELRAAAVADWAHAFSRPQGGSLAARAKDRMRRVASRAHMPDGGRGRAGPFGSSSASLHAKTFAVDGAHAFIGSLNFDPRSAHLNTELGFVIDSAAIATRLAEIFDHSVPQMAYTVELSEPGDLVWIEQSGAGEVRHRSEPGAGFGRRGLAALLSHLPIDPLL